MDEWNENKPETVDAALEELDEALTEPEQTEAQPEQTPAEPDTPRPLAFRIFALVLAILVIIGTLLYYYFIATCR